VGVGGFGGAVVGVGLVGGGWGVWLVFGCGVAFPENLGVSNSVLSRGLVGGGRELRA